MGNCLVTNNKVSSEGDNVSYVADEAMKSNVAPSSSSLSSVGSSKDKKRVAFRLHEDGEDQVDEEKKECGDGNPSSTKNGVLRIKVVVSQEELGQILDFRKDNSQFSSVGQLLGALMLRNRSNVITKVKARNIGHVDKVWKPALESIPEEN